MSALSKCFPKRRPAPRQPDFPVKARHAEFSIICSADDDVGRPTMDLLNLALSAARRACDISMEAVSSRMQNGPFYPDVWPGEHYKLLAGVIAQLEPKQVIEIGTFTGLSALAMLQTLPRGGTLHTFDIIPWNKIPDPVLREADFKDYPLNQVIGDLSIAAVMDAHRDLLQDADLIFVDGPKDGIFEDNWIAGIREISLPKKPLMIFDDIRVWNMLKTRREIEKPKLDMTSFGHWSGTGFVSWE